MATGSTYPYQRGYDGALIIRIDTRPDNTLIETIAGPIPREKKVPVHKKQAQYKFDVMDGFEHPLSIETDNYALVMIHQCKSTHETFRYSQTDLHQVGRSFSEGELAFIQSVSERSEVEWAIDNSFDGLYVQKSEDHATFSTQYKFAVYLKEEQAVFWKLKFHGR